MIPLSAIAKFKWDKDLGLRMQSFRKAKKYSRSALAQQINSMYPDATPCTLTLIQKYEDAVPQSISLELATSISAALEVDLPQLLAVDKVFVLWSSI